MNDALKFVLNGEPVTIEKCAPAATLLNYLRYQRGLTGTKEGCAEGDCGACTVALGEISGGALRYGAVNACILFLPMLHGKSVVTVEGLASSEGALHPCQQAIVETHGSQCGFCTPGFVMSLYVMACCGKRPDLARINDALAGNLCRCTGYGPLIAAAERACAGERPAWDLAREVKELALLDAIGEDDDLAIVHEDGAFFAPASLDGFARLCEEHPEATIVGGATDVGLWVTKQDRELPVIIHAGRVRELRSVVRADGVIRIGAGATYAEAESALAEAYPDFGELIRRIGGFQVRNMGTIGGNIANGSPIGDTPPALIALGARLILRRGGVRRSMPLEDFFIAYGRQDRSPGEFVEAVEVPLAEDPARLRCYKISKRFDQDISALLGCFNITVADGVVVEARICYGGMAGTPKRAVHVEAALAGRPWTQETIEAAIPAFEQDFAPISDMRGSAEYRMLSAKNLLRKYFMETRMPETKTRLAGHGAAAS